MSAAWPKMYRTMLSEDPSASPAVPAVGTAANMLGACVPPSVPTDVHPDGEGKVGPCSEGLSVAPRLTALPPSRVPERLGHLRHGARGNNTHRVFRIGEANFERAPLGDSLELMPTSSKHGVIQPLQRMSIGDYQRELAATQRLWVVDEGG